MQLWYLSHTYAQHAEYVNMYVVYVIKVILKLIHSYILLVLII